MKWILLLTLILAGCAVTPEQKLAKYDHKYGADCAAMGYEKGTKEYNQCLYQMHHAAISKATLILNR